jgi:hypothetical protein
LNATATTKSGQDDHLKLQGKSFFLLSFSGIAFAAVAIQEPFFPPADQNPLFLPEKEWGRAPRFIVKID